MIESKTPGASGAFLLARSTAHLLQRAQSVAADRFSRRALPVSLRQFAVLAAIAEHPGASQAELARAASIDRSTLADMLKRLESMGFIAKAVSEADARANSVQLTPEGEAILADAAEDARRADQAVLDALPKAKRRTFQDTLLKLAHALDKQADETARQEVKKRKRELKRARRLADGVKTTKKKIRKSERTR